MLSGILGKIYVVAQQGSCGIFCCSFLLQELKKIVILDCLNGRKGRIHERIKDTIFLSKCFNGVTDYVIILMQCYKVCNNAILHVLES